MDKCTKFRVNLNQLLVMDYAVELYNYNDAGCTISFNHLNSVHNGLAFISFENDYRYVDFQYHKHNKRVEKIINEILDYIKLYYRLRKRFDYIIEEITYYHNLAMQLYNCKYSVEIDKHTFDY
jgi:hypothetical protein